MTALLTSMEMTNIFDDFIHLTDCMSDSLTQKHRANLFPTKKANLKMPSRPAITSVAFAKFNFPMLATYVQE